MAPNFGEFRRIDKYRSQITESQAQLSDKYSILLDNCRQF